MADGTTRWSGMDTRSWARLVSLVAPGMAPLPPRHHARDGALPGGMLLVAHDGTTVLRALHTLRGVVATGGEWSGRETLAALAAQSDTRFAGIPVVMHSSLSSVANKKLGQQVGVDAYVAKFKPEELGDCIARMLRG